MRKIKKYFKWIVIFIIIILIIGYIILKCSLNNNESVEVVLDEFDLEFNENINVKEEREDLYERLEYECIFKFKSIHI